MPKTRKPSESVGARQRNLTLLLRAVQAERETSQADLARRLGLARSTVLAIVDDLLDWRLLKELGPGVSGGGRRPMRLTLDDSAFHLVGVDIGATHVAVVAMSLGAQIVARQYRDFPTRDDPQGTLALVEALVARVLVESRSGKRELVGIGVGVPSPIDVRSPGHVSSVVLPRWTGVDIADRLKTRFEVPVLVENDANLGALWEARWGNGVHVDNMAFIKVATGIGAGLVVNGEIYRGSRGVAGEIGHVSIDPTGPQCVCGLRGCLNTLIGTEPLLARARAAAGGRKRRAFERLEDLLDAAKDGDRAAVDTLEFAGRQLGLGVGALLNLFNPALVVIGGGLVDAGEHLMEPLRQTVARHCFSENFLHARILSSKPGEFATARGAATLVLDAAFEAPDAFFKRPTRSARLAV